LIQIDDAGSGSLLGGTVIGALRVETGEYQYDVIPLKYYQGKNFNQKKYIHHVVDIIDHVFNQLQVTKEEPIEVCRGYMFDSLIKWLKNENYQFNSTKIEDPLQSIIEKTFDDYAIELGLPETFITYTKYPFHFHRILKWVYADYPNRSQLCKTGWKSWSKYGKLEISTGEEHIKNREWTCLKCNQVIPRDTVAAVKSYTSNRPNKIYLHTHCLN